MHCLNPKELINPHYNPKTDKGRQNLFAWRVSNYPIDYPDDYKIIIPCGKCLGCLRDKSSSWRVRLLHEHLYGEHKSCTCLTLTINPKNYDTFNSRAAVAARFRSFIDRLRYYTPERKSPKRWFVSELGEERGRLHFHGFVWDTLLDETDWSRAWSYGFIRCSPLRSCRQLGYATKYITKPSVRWHSPMVFTSPGLGKGYTEQSLWTDWHHFGSSDSPINMYCYFDHYVYALPRYYRDKIFDPAEVARFKAKLSEDNRPYKKFFAGATYNDPLAFAEARRKVFEDTVRAGRSRPASAVKPQSVLLPAAPFCELMKNHSFEDTMLNPIQLDDCPF